MTPSRNEILKNFKGGKWFGEETPSALDALQPPICKCESNVWIKEDDGLDRRCFICGKRKQKRRT